jgi:hypothetical protein
MYGALTPFVSLRALRGLQHMSRATQVSTVGTNLHQNRLDALALVQDGLCAHLQASYAAETCPGFLQQSGK